MTFGIQPEQIDKLDIYEVEIYANLIPLYFEYQQKSMENTIKKAISEMM